MKKMNLISVIALVMIFIGGIGAILLTIGQAKDSARDKQDLIDVTKDENTQLKTQLTDLQKERNDLKSDLEKRDDRINEQTTTIIDLNKQLVEKSNYISNYLIGGKGFPLVTTSSIQASNPKDNERTTFTLHNDTDLPLYDITAIVFDWNYILSKKSDSSDPSVPHLKQTDLEKSMIYRFDNPQMFEKSNIITKDRFDLHDALLYIKLKCRSSFVHEKMAFVVENKVIYSGYIVHDGDGNVLKEWMSEGITSSAKLAIKKKFDQIPNKVAFKLTE
jgi:hypothetical protein